MNFSEIIEENNEYYTEIKKHNKNYSKKNSLEYKKIKQFMNLIKEGLPKIQNYYIKKLIFNKENSLLLKTESKTYFYI